MKTYPRDMEDRVLQVAQHFPAVLLTGARQVGKTTLLRELFPEAPFVTLDLPSAAYEAEHDGVAFLKKLEGYPVVVLDEVQYAPGLFRYLKLAIDADRHRMGRFIMTGSQKFALMGPISESLAGRCAILEMDTMSGIESRAGAAMRGQHVADAELIWRGGYPELWRDLDLPAQDFFASYLATYLERDVRQLVNVTNLRDFERFIRICATRSGNLINLNSLATDVGIAATTAKQWLTVLEASNIVHLLPPYFRNHGKRLVKTPKLYFRDTGLLCFLLGIRSPEQMMASPFVGAIWETYVLGQMMRRMHVAGEPAEIYGWRDAHGVEVDFVIWLDGRVRLVECKWTEDGSQRKPLKPMHEVRALLGDDAAASHLLVCRSEHDHWHPQDPRVRVVNGLRVHDWFDVPDPEGSRLREDPVLALVAKKAVRKKGLAKKATKKKRG